MTSPAIKNYLHSITITKKEVELVKELLKEGEETLKDFLPEKKHLQTYFLVDLLSNALKDFKNNENFVKEILTLRNKDNEAVIYSCLKESKHGLALIRNNPSVHNKDSEKVFLDILNKSSSKGILTFVKENKENIDIETIYKADALDLKLVQSLEKEGFNFDGRILPVINNKKNYSKPGLLLNYMDKFKDSVEEKFWNKQILKMCKAFDHEHYDWYGKNRFKDSFFLVTKLRNPGQYKWGGKIPESRHDYFTFNFNYSLQAYFKEPSLNDVYIDEKNIRNIEQLKEFFANNDIHFESLKYNTDVFLRFIDVISDSVIENAIKNSWKDMFRFPFHREKAFFNKDDIIIPDLYKDNPLLLNERVRPIIMREYFSQEEYRLDTHDEQNLLERLGINKKTIIEDRVLSKYYDVLSLENMKNILSHFRLSEIELEKQLLDYQLPNNGSNQPVKKLKI